MMIYDIIYLIYIYHNHHWCIIILRFVELNDKITIYVLTNEDYILTKDDCVLTNNDCVYCQLWLCIKNILSNDYACHVQFR